MEYLIFIYMSITIVILFEIILFTNLQHLHGNILSPRSIDLDKSNTNANCNFEYNSFTEFIFTCKFSNDKSIHQRIATIHFIS